MTATRVSTRRLSPRRAPKQARSQETVQAILDAAAQVFERHGYASGTTNRIAQRAGVSIGSLYQYFPNKDAILVALVRRHLRECAAVLEPHLLRLGSGARPEEVLDGVIEAMVALHAMAPGLHRVLFEETPLPAGLRAEIHELEDQLVELAATALLAQGGQPVRDARLTARVTVAAIEGLTHRLVLRPAPGVGSAEIAREIGRLVRAYLHASERGEP